jgi:hypothetical protein
MIDEARQAYRLAQLETVLQLRDWLDGAVKVYVQDAFRYGATVREIANASRMSQAEVRRLIAEAPASRRPGRP